MSVFNIKKILVPVDLGESSLNALDTAVALARKYQALLQILYVDVPDFDLLSGDAPLLYNNYTIYSSETLAALSGSVQHKYGIKSVVLREQGNVSDSIIKVSLMQRSDLIVMGTNGASGSRDGFMGSNTYNVIKHARCPVLSVPNRMKYLEFKKVLFPIRPITRALRRYDVVSHFINSSGELNVLGVSGEKMEKDALHKILGEIDGSLNAGGIRGTTSWGAGKSIADDVINYAGQYFPDLLVVTALLDVSAKPHFIGPNTQKIVHSLKLPILSIKKIDP